MREPLYKRLNWTNTLFLIISPILALTFVPLDVYLHGLDWRMLLIFVLACFATSISITGGYHRFFSHRSYESSTWLKLFYLIFGAAALQGSAIKWSTDHRRHHRFVDTDQDPYSINKGFWYAHIGWVFFKEEPGYEATYAPDLVKDPLIHWQHRYYVPIALFVGFGIPAIIGAFMGNAWGGLVFGGFARIVVTHHCTFLINSLCHFWGEQPYNTGNTARDNFVMAFFTYGEGYHNFHHQFQADYRNGVRWYHWDPTKWWISCLSWVGSTKRLKKVSDLDIFRARIEADENLLKTRGLDEKWFAPIRARMESAQERMRELRACLRNKSDLRIQQARTEMQLSRLEFKATMAQWRVLLRASKRRSMIG